MAKPINRALLTFYTSGGEILRLSISRANLDKTGAEAQATMAGLVENGALVINGGIPRHARSAELVTTTRRVIAQPQQ